MVKYYAVANGRTIGIFTNWDDCSNSVNGYPNALYKKFGIKEDAEYFIQSNVNQYGIDPEIYSDLSISDLGTGPDIDKSPSFIPDYYVYTDGACTNNGKSTALAGFGIFFGIDDIRNVSKPIDGKHTNNVAELTAIIETYNIIENDININGKKVVIVSDSKYAIRCVSSYGEKCHKQQWNVDIPNKQLVKMAYELYMDQSNIQFIHVMAHTNNMDIHSVGNYNADKLATQSIGL
jgi:ribonuclease HI